MAILRSVASRIKRVVPSTGTTAILRAIAGIEALVKNVGNGENRGKRGS